MSLYRVFVTPDALAEIKNLPGNIRQRVRQSIREFARYPHPPQSKPLKFPDPNRHLYRLQLDNWRVVYAITENEKAIDVLAIRKRPPYDYGDLE